MKRLIVNADDFGYTRGVNRAIAEACRSGVVTSTSLLANGAAFEDAVEIARAEPPFDGSTSSPSRAKSRGSAHGPEPVEGRLDVGCHLNFVEGRPVSPPERIPHLLGHDGRFLKAWQLAARLLRRAVPESEIELEAGAQIEKLLRAGVPVSHVDTHKHTHVHPAVARAVARAAQRHDIRWIRRPFENFLPRSAREKTHGIKNMPWLPHSIKRLAVASLNWLAPSFERRMKAMGMTMPDFFTGVMLTGRLTRQAFAEILAALPPGVTEVMCHPGYCDAELRGSSTRLCEERELERETVSDGAWLAQAREREIALTTFRELSSPDHFAARDPLPAFPAAAFRE